LSIIREYNGSRESEHARIIIRTKSYIRRILIPISRTTSSNPVEFQKMLKATDSAFETANFRLEKNPAIVDRLTDFERAQVPTTFKFGILYCRAGQTTEAEMFANNFEHTSPEYDKFLSLLGQKVELKGWKKFSGGLDTSTGLTGEHTIFTNWRTYSILFHVSTMLPHSAQDDQHVEKKRHIGNDIVLIVFQDENAEPFEPECIQSTFIHTIIVVKVCRIKRSKVQYKIAVCTKAGVPAFKPKLPQPAVFFHNEDFREYLLCKCVNSEIASYEGKSILAARLRKTRGVLLQNLKEEFRIRETDRSRRRLTVV